MKTVAIIGSTGSIGTQALDVLRQFKDEYEVIALSANSNVELLKKQIVEFRPKFATLQDHNSRYELIEMLQDSQTEIIDCDKPLEVIIKEADADITLVAVVGAAGLLPSLSAAKLGKRLALANKESLVLGGDILLQTCRENRTELIPVDSEHSAIFQCLLGQDTKELKKIVLTASGGPFLNTEKSKMDRASVEEALKHPNWDMGGKITIDSATMMNKGLEVIEAHHLFQLDYNKIEVVVHPQSLVHSYVEYSDGSIIAQLGLADMRVPIQLAFTFPKRKHRLESLNLIGKTLEFFEPDINKFGCLQLAYDAGLEGGDRPIVLNAANEIAVEYYLSKRIYFGSIFEIIKDTLEQFPTHRCNTLEELIYIDQEVRRFTKDLINSGGWRI